MPKAIITGCSTGIGRATAAELTGRGYEVVATARRPETLDDLDVAQRLALDVTDDASVAAARDAAGDADVVINNAGISLRGPIESVPLDEVRRTMETNFFGVVRVVQAFAPAMRERGSGTFVNVSSVAGRIGLPTSGFYAASKFAVEALSEVMHIELGRFGVKTIIVEPGYIATSIGENAVRFGDDAPPYDALFAQMDRADDSLLEGERPGPEIVATAIAEALEAVPTPLRVPVGVDAEMAVAARAAMDDAQFEDTMRTSLKLDW